ncbi:MAG: hypothetical protein VX793_04395 [Pseudomonadota bacterium]|nr:hypothetical protein [Pseudomonadota bacterium]
MRESTGTIIAGAILLLGSPVAMAVDVSLHSQWHSKYVTEGRDNLDSNPLVSLGADLGFQDVTGGVWQAWANGSDYRENNLYLEYAPTFEYGSPYLNITYLQFHPQGADDLETGAGFIAPVHPWLSVAFDGTWSKNASGAFYAVSLQAQRELTPTVTGKLHLTQTYDDGYASDDYNGPNHREVAAVLLWQWQPEVEVYAGWQYSWAGEDVRRDGGSDQSWGQVGLTTYF